MNQDVVEFGCLFGIGYEEREMPSILSEHVLDDYTGLPEESGLLVLSESRWLGCKADTELCFD